MLTRTLAGALLLLTAIAPAHADTVWLKNGRVLQAERARVVGDQVIVEQRGLRLALPISAVERIRRDDRRTPRRPTVLARPDLRSRRERARSAPRAIEPVGDRRANPFELDPSSADYWHERFAWIRDRIAAADGYGHEARAERAAYRALERELFGEARRLGIPGRWLDDSRWRVR